MRIHRPSALVFDGIIEALSVTGDSDTSMHDRVRPNTKAFILALPESLVGSHHEDASAGHQRAPYRDAEAAVQPSCDSESIAAELGLTQALTAAEITALRRTFALRNHPDRVPEACKALATERMTVANRLMDAAAAKIKQR